MLTKTPINYDKAPFKLAEGVEMPIAWLHNQFKAAPAVKARKDNDRPYPFAEMDIGDSFLVPAATSAESDVIQRAVSGAACSYSRHAVNRFEVVGFATRKVQNGIRVFRIY